MKKTKNFLKTTLLGGVAVILPSAILLFIFKWIFNFITGLIQPITNIVMAKSDMREIVADILVILIIMISCFIIGVIIKTKFGKFIHENLENHILNIAPGYTMIKETIMQFLGKKQSPFSSVALVQVFENSALMTAFITDSHPTGSFTVFVPTGPNPTSGNIYHLKSKYVHHIDTPVETAMRSIISCGAGSTELFEKLNQKMRIEQ